MRAESRAGVHRDPVAVAAAYAAAVLALASAATTAYWVLGGTALLDTVGGYAEDLARSGTAVSLLVGVAVIVVKVVGGALALALAHLRGPAWRRRAVVLPAPPAGCCSPSTAGCSWSSGRSS